MDIDQFKRVEELFDAALDLPADRRRGFLERACGSDTKLRETVERLLRHAERDGAGVDPDAEQARSPAPPATLGPVLPEAGSNDDPRP
jgi:hypothetical protein